MIQRKKERKREEKEGSTDYTDLHGGCGGRKGREKKSSHQDTKTMGKKWKTTCIMIQEDEGRREEKEGTQRHRGKKREKEKNVEWA